MKKRRQKDIKDKINFMPRYEQEKKKLLVDNTRTGKIERGKSYTVISDKINIAHKLSIHH